MDKTEIEITSGARDHFEEVILKLFSPVHDVLSHDFSPWLKSQLHFQKILFIRHLHHKIIYIPNFKPVGVTSVKQGGGTVMNE